jgi:hypothetical protein
MVQSRKSSTSERSSSSDQQSTHSSGGTENFSTPRSGSSMNRARLRSGYSSQDNHLQRRREMMPSRLAAYNFRSGSCHQRGTATLLRGVARKLPSSPQTPLPMLFGTGPDYHSFPRVEVSTLEALEAASALTSLDFR